MRNQKNERLLISRFPRIISRSPIALFTILVFVVACTSSGPDGSTGCIETCDPNATCTFGMCVCNDGYFIDQGTCYDIDECANDNGGCGDSTFYSCTNNDGAPPTCTDIDTASDVDADSDSDTDSDTDTDTDTDIDAGVGNDAGADGGIDTCSDAGTDLPYGGSCCAAHSGLGCGVAEIESCVCAIEWGCCVAEWRSECADLVESGGCGTCSPAEPCTGFSSLRVLVLGSSSTNVNTVAQSLEEAFAADGEYDDLLITRAEIENGTLLNHYYVWTGRDSRLSGLDAEWDYVVLSDFYTVVPISPEVYFEGVRALAELARASGAIPVLLMNTDGSPSPDGDGNICNNQCLWSGDGTCDDGEFGPSATYCAFGTDCDDCGARLAGEAPQYGVEELTWRVGIGTGSIVAPAGMTTSTVLADSFERPYVAAASLYTALTGTSAAAGGYVPFGWTAQRWSEITDAVLARYVIDQSAVHYTSPYSGAVRIEPMAIPDPYRFATSGTSSEAGYRTAMNALLAREGISYVSGVSIGTCQWVNTGCINLTTLQQNQYMTLYARGYYDSQDAIRTAGDSPDLLVQMYDRHWDSTNMDGINALDDIIDRSYPFSNIARDLGVAWLPQHINFGKLKIATGANLLKDAQHATDAVQAGLAAMSYVSRTGLSPTTAGVDSTTASAITFGEETIRTMSTFSMTGIHIPDTAENRVTPK